MFEDKYGVTAYSNRRVGKCLRNASLAGSKVKLITYLRGSCLLCTPVSDVHMPMILQAQIM